MLHKENTPLKRAFLPRLTEVGASCLAALVKSVVADGFSAWYDFTDTGNRIDRNCPLNRAVFGRVSRRVMKKTKPETLIYVRAEAGGTRG